MDMPEGIKDKNSLGKLLLVTLFTFVLSGCGGTTPAVPPPEPDVVQPAVSAQPISWSSDGAILDNEYSAVQEIGEMQVFSRLEGDTVCIALRTQNAGYVALGISPENKMKGADIIICRIEDGQALISDEYSTGPMGPHSADSKLGGTDDILNPSGSSIEGWTVFELQRKLSTGDGYDKDLVAGENPVIWSVGGSTDIGQQHSSRGYGSLLVQ